MNAQLITGYTLLTVAILGLGLTGGYYLDNKEYAKGIVALLVCLFFIVATITA